jgi:hypothetical protein
MAFAALAVTVAAAAALGVPPVVTTNAVIQKWGAEAENEVQGDGVVFWRDDKGMLYVGDGVTPGGKAVCVGHGDEKWYSWTNDVSANGHKLKLNQFYSIQAESSSMVIRYGSNVIWRIIGDDSGELANITAEYLDPATLRIQAAAAGDGVTLQVCTDLMAADAWKPATNAVVVAETDVSTTWDVTLGEETEFYRVLASTTRGKGIYAERPLVASEGLVVPEGQGITMGTNTWSYLPASAGDLAEHVADYNNPHGVTAAQVGAIPTSWTNAAEVKSLTIGEGTCTNLAELASTGFVFAVSGRVSAIEADYVQAADIADFATTQAVASLERRIGALEYPETCTLVWSTNYMTNSDATYYVPTNFPTKKLMLYLCDELVTNVNVDVPRFWTPPRDVEIDLIPVRPVNSTSPRSLNIKCAGGGVATFQNNSAFRFFRFIYNHDMEAWSMCSFTLPVMPRFISASGEFAQPTPLGGPSTVEEWMALHPDWATP